LTEEQSEALEKKLNKSQSIDEYKCFVVMRCWHPRAREVIKNVQSYNPNEVVLMPLYPQYSAATSGSSIKEWKDVCKKNDYKIKTSTICCYPTNKNFINAHTKEIIKKIKNLKNFKLIFSAHGLPEKNIKKGDPYQWQIEQSVNKIIENLNLENLDWVLSYQSRVGPLKWIGPSTDDVIVENSKIGKHIVLVPIAFVSEHSETLVELDIEYKKLAEDNGCKQYTRVPALGINEDFINAMSELIMQKEEYKFNEELYPPKIKCPSHLKKCPCLNYE
jgi:ferrochelatase